VLTTEGELEKKSFQFVSE